MLIKYCPNCNTLDGKNLTAEMKSILIRRGYELSGDICRPCGILYLVASGLSPTHAQEKYDSMMK